MLKSSIHKNGKTKHNFIFTLEHNNTLYELNTNTKETSIQVSYATKEYNCSTCIDRIILLILFTNKVGMLDTRFEDMFYDKCKDVWMCLNCIVIISFSPFRLATSIHMMAKNKDISDYSLAEMNENSNLIRLYTEKTIIWRGEEFATFNVDVELSEELALQNEGCTLSVALLKESTKEVIYPKDSNHLNMHFLQHGSANKPWEGMFDKSYLKDTVYIHIHKDLFADGDKFNVIAFTKEEHVIIPRVVKKKKEGKIIFGASESIS